MSLVSYTMVGHSSAIRDVFRMIERAGRSDANVMIRGESGVGKELVARRLHETRRGGEFVPVNCAAIPDQLLEAELFGHRAGAFTGAARDRAGLLEEADGGTLFLDEIAELPLPFQAKLLRVLDHGEVRRLGDTRPRNLNFRLVTATHRDIRKEVEARRFRADLYWRICGIRIDIPPLRARLEDIPDLAAAILGESRISADAITALQAHSWPGNVRELKSVLQAASAIADGDTISAAHVVHALESATAPSEYLANTPPPTASLDCVVQWHIQRVLEHAQGCRSIAARVLGIDPKTLWRKIQFSED